MQNFTITIKEDEIMIQIDTLEEAKKYIERKETIIFQNKSFYKTNNFENFIKEIENGITLELPKTATQYTWHTNFGDIYCNKLIVTSKYLLFFDNDKLILQKSRSQTDDIEYSFKRKDGAICSANPIIYNYEQDKQYVDLKPIPYNWR